MPKITDRHGRPFSGTMPGLVEAIVVDNQDPELLGRVRVRFSTLPDSPLSAWCRVVTPSAGKNRGWVSIPEIGDEVVVGFMYGDYNHAIVVGAVYNGVDQPVYQNEDGSNSYRVFTSRSGHRVIFDDTPGFERIILQTAHRTVSIVWFSAMRTLIVSSAGNFIVEAGGTVTLRCKDFKLDADASISLRAGKTIEVQTGSELTVNGGKLIVLTAADIRIN